MDELITIIKQNINKYPLCEVRDIIKLIYQNEFGNGHMLGDKSKVLAMIMAEYKESTVPYPLFENIGNNYYRLNLGQAKKLNIDPDIIADVFIKSAEYSVGSKKQFCKKIEAFIDICESLNFTKTDALDIFNHIKESNFAPISHSDEYKKVYKPAYRLVHKNVAKGYFFDCFIE